jgi:hypothetical protein
MPWRLLLWPLSRLELSDGTPAKTGKVAVPGRYLVIMLRLIALGMVLDLAVSGVLAYFIDRVDANRAALARSERVSACWDRTLTDALHRRPMQVVIGEANACVVLQGGTRPAPGHR